MDNVTSSDKPIDRLTWLAAEMLKTLEQEQNSDVRGLVLLTTEEDGGMAMCGYDDNMQAMGDLLGHVQALAQASGGDMSVITVPESPEGLA